MKNDYVLPLYGLSCEIQGIINHFAEVKNCPTNFVATSLMMAIGGLAGKRLVVKDGGYFNYGQGYSCLIAPPGIGKSPAMDSIMEAVDAIDYRNYLAYTNEIKQWKLAKQETEKPILRKIAADDVTIEKLMGLLSQNENGIILHCDELTDLTSNLNRYSNGDNLPKLLKMWSNGTVRVDRKNDEPLMVQHPYLSILSSTQPINLDKIFKKHEGTGFFSRWLFCLPNPKPNKGTEPNHIYYDYWNRVVDTIYDLPQMEITFADDTLPLLKSFDDIREELSEILGEKDSELAEYYMKQKYNIRRLAGIVHLISAESDIIKGELCPQITKQEFIYAEKLVEFYEECAKEVLGMIDLKGPSEMTDKKLLQMFNERFHPTNISELARLIGKSQQYVSKVLLHQDTKGLERAEDENKRISEEVRLFVKSECPRLQSIDGLPTEEDIQAMMQSASSIADVKTTLKKMENYRGIEKAKGNLYNIMFSQLRL